MSTKPQGEILRLRGELSYAMKNCIPSKEVGAGLIFSIIRLHQVEDEIRNEKRLKERRRLKNEFETGKRAIKTTINLLRKNQKRAQEVQQGNRRKALP